MRAIVTGVLAGTAALSLLLTPAYAAPTQPSAAYNGPDPTALARLTQAQRFTHYTAWARYGATRSGACESAAGKAVAVIALDTKTHIQRYRYASPNYPTTPMLAFSKGHKTYYKLSTTERQSMRVHGLRPPSWVFGRSSTVWPGKHPQYEFTTAEEFGFDELTEANRPGHETVFTGVRQLDGDTSNPLAYQEITVVDSLGRLVSVSSSTRDSGGVLVGQCMQTWDWTRPTLKLPTKKVERANQRYQAERRATSEADGLAAQGNQRLRQGATAAEVVAWLHTKVRAKHRLAHGIQWFRQWHDLPTLRYVIKVNGGAVSFRPIR